MQSLAIFNNKGGVGKTTLLCNLSAYLALELKKRVLVIDADPQCNTTQSMFEDTEVVNLYDSNQSTIRTLAKPLAAGKGYSKEIEPITSDNFGIDLIPGDPGLALMEDLLATDWGQAVAGDTRGLRTTFLFANLLSRCEKYDFVIFDMGPSLGAINRAILLATDFFVTPMSIDIFSLRAIENISLSLQGWKARLERGLELNQSSEDLEIEDPSWKLQFAGYVTQQYTAKRDTEGERRAVHAYDRILKKIPKVIERELIAKFSTPKKGITFELGTIPSLHSLVPLSQLSRKPIFALRARDGVRGAHFGKVEDYRGIMDGIARQLIKNLGALK